MDTERYCAYNTTRDCFLCSEVTLIDTVLDPLGTLRVLVEGLAEGTQTGLWLTPLASIPPVPRIYPFDIVYLDKNHQVMEAAELLPEIECPVFEGPSQSALVLPLHTISATQTAPGDSLRICIDRELERQPAGVGISASAASSPGFPERSSANGSRSVEDVLVRLNPNDEQPAEIACFHGGGQASAGAEPLDADAFPARAAGYANGGPAVTMGVASTLWPGNGAKHVEGEGPAEPVSSPPAAQKMEFTVAQSLRWRTSPPTGIPQSSGNCKATAPARSPIIAVTNGSQIAAVPESGEAFSEATPSAGHPSNAVATATLEARCEEPTPVAHEPELRIEEAHSAMVFAGQATFEPDMMTPNGSSIPHRSVLIEEAWEIEGHLPDPMCAATDFAEHPEWLPPVEAQPPTPQNGKPQTVESSSGEETTGEETTGEETTGAESIEQSNSLQVIAPLTDSVQRPPAARRPSLGTRILGWFKHSRVVIPPMAKVASDISRAATRESLTAQLRRWLEPESPLSDRRRSNRRQISSLVAHYWTGGAPKPHRVANISECGFYVITEDRWVPETVIQMTLQKRVNNRQRMASMSILAKVVRSGKDGVGAEFVMSETLDLLSREMLGARGTDRRTLSRFLR